MPNFVPEDILQRIREEAQRARTIRVPSSYRPPTPADFAPDTQILCFDQSLSSSGWALLNTDEGVVSVVDSGTIKPPSLGRIKGFESTLVKSILLARELRTLVNALYGRFEETVVEMPSVTGYRTESSLVAAATICATLDEAGESQPSLVSRNSAGAVLCGNRYVSKEVSSKFVNELVGDRHPTGTGQWTEHVRDAVLVGLRHLYLEGK